MWSAVSRLLQDGEEAARGGGQRGHFSANAACSHTCPGRQQEFSRGVRLVK